MVNHRVTVEKHGKMFETLEDILPQNDAELKILFVAKVPTPDSVTAGHYFQGNQGTMLWNALKKYQILTVSNGEKEDDHLIQNGYGMIDLVKEPRQYGFEPHWSEYEQGILKLFHIIECHKPKVLFFVYKKVLDVILKNKFARKTKSSYGFNQNLEGLFGCKVFVFPMPGTPCRSESAKFYMEELKRYLSELD